MMTDKTDRDLARQTFRQFAWNLAGTLTPPKIIAKTGTGGRIPRAGKR